MPLFQVDIPRERLLYTSIKRFANFPFFSSSLLCLFLPLLRFSCPRFVPLSFSFSLSTALIRLYLILTRTFFSLRFLFVVSVYCVHSRSLLLVVLLSLFQLPVTLLPSYRSPSSPPLFSPPTSHYYFSHGFPRVPSFGRPIKFPGILCLALSQS